MKISTLEQPTKIVYFWTETTNILQHSKDKEGRNIVILTGISHEHAYRYGSPGNSISGLEISGSVIRG
jgi:hypothetical protein